MHHLKEEYFTVILREEKDWVDTKNNLGTSLYLVQIFLNPIIK